jgi:histidyl-tRNA synthetase
MATDPKKIEPRTLKGFPDYAPEEQVVRQRMFATIQGVFERFGFLPLSTPALEYKEILLNKYGDEEKLVYSFKDNGGRDVALRYDLTVPLARFVAQNQGSLMMPFKRYQIAPVWRAENTQKGRMREFYQCDVDTVGTESPLADAEVIACLCQALEAVGVKNYEVRLNDRRNFEVFGDSAAKIIRAIDKFDKIGVDGVVAELEKQNIDPALIGKAKEYLNGTMNACSDVLNELKRLIAAQGVVAEKIVIDPTTARGLDYYSSTVFEIKLTDKPEFGSVVGGGRYDGLVDQFSDQPLSAVGGSIGIDRLVQALEELGKLDGSGAIQVLVLNIDEKLQDEYVKLATQLRGQNINTELYYQPAKLDKQFKYAEAKGIRYAVILGQAEATKGVVQLKDLNTRDQQEVKRADLLEVLSAKLL